MEPLKYFVFNKRSDFQSGYLEHMDVTEQGIRLDAGESVRRGTFISSLMDSREEGNRWHRAVVRSVSYGDDSIRFCFYCCDSPQVMAEGRLWEWNRLIADRSLSLEKKHELMRPFLAHEILNPEDVLLYHARGRYLWVEIELLCQDRFRPEIRNMKIYAENNSWIRYLPELYQTGGRDYFLERYLSLFETVYEDLDMKIRNAARQLDPDSAETEFLHWLAKWTGIREVHLWPEDKLRTLLQGIVKRNLLRGTRQYMEYMIETFTGERPFFVEYAELEQYRENRKVYRILKQYYAHGPYEVNILVREQAVPGLREQEILKRLIENMKPAHIQVHLIILRTCIYLNQNVYVGINSMLGTYERANLRGVTGIPSLVEASSLQEEKYEESEKFSI